jgi:hypothetical protein
VTPDSTSNVIEESKVELEALSLKPTQTFPDPVHWEEFKTLTMVSISANVVTVAAPEALALK